jgi:hypothetical protein
MNPTSKDCNDCQKNKPFSEFNKSKAGRHGYMNVCKPCRKQHRTQLNFPAPTTGTRQCPRCQVVKEVKDFYKDIHSSFGLQTYCKLCSVHNSQVWASTFDGFIKKLYKEIQHNAKKRAKDLTFNITIDDIKNLYNAQKGVCALTGYKLTHNALPENRNNEHIINYYNLSVDRIDSSKGYEIDNIQLVCAIINRMKTDMTDNTFIEFCKAVANHSVKNTIV